jgi:hypothetical protein
MARSAIVDECIALIAPDAQHEPECRRQIERGIDMICWLYSPKSKVPLSMLRELKLKPVGRKADREALLRFADALEEAAMQLDKCGLYLSLRLPAFDAARFSKELKTLVTTAREVADSMHLPHGRSLNTLKLMTAFHAQNLIEDYAIKPATLTIGGPYYELASVLYGAVTGERDADLSRQCKEASRRQRTNEES